MPTLGDVFSVYVKPSLEGRLVVRKRTSNQGSARLKARQQKLAALRGTERVPAKVAHNKCVQEGKAVMQRVYEPGVGYKEQNVCPIKYMRGYLKSAMGNLGG